MNVRASVALTIVVAALLIPAVKMTSAVNGEYNVMYSASGTYDVAPGQTRVVDEAFSVTYTNGSVTIDYYLMQLPYGINSSILYLSSVSRATMVHETEGLTMWYEDPSNPFLTYFGCPLIVMIKTTDEYKLTIKWQFHEGFAVYVEIEKLHEMQRILRITYESSTIDLYSGLDESDIQRIEAWKFVFSPAGMITLSIPFIVIIIFACYISSVKKKIRVENRGGRFLTR